MRGCRERGLLADAVCVRNHRLVTFWRRLTRDLREHRKPPLVLLRRGWLLMRAEPDVVAHAVSCGATPMTPRRGVRPAVRARRPRRRPDGPTGLSRAPARPVVAK